MTNTHDRTDEAGFSLSELLIVVALMGVVLGAIYAAASAMMQGARIAETQSTFARDSGEPLRIAEKALMQATDFEAGMTSQTVTFQMDRRMDALNQKVRISTTTDKRLHYEEWQLNAIGTEVSKTRDQYYCQSKSVANRERGVAFLKYYDRAGNEIYDSTSADPYEDVASNARVVVLTLALTVDKTNFQASRTVYLRNRQ